MHILDKLNQRIDQTKSLLCIGLDSDITKIPHSFLQTDNPQFAFNRSIIDATQDICCAYKINSAFYEANGLKGWMAMAQTIDYLHQNIPQALIIMDAKRADIGNTSAQYAQAFFETLRCDAITLHPWLGKEALAPFLAYPDKASIILCKTSNLGGNEIQDWSIHDQNKAIPLWQKLARQVSQEWNELKNCMLVVGATQPEALKIIRSEVGDMPILVPGIGAQGGDLKAILTAGLTANKRGLIINASRSIIFAESPRTAAMDLHQAIQSHCI